MQASLTQPILISGAGPTGLTLAAVLAKRKVPFRLIDKAGGRDHLSKALGVQAGTLEALANTFGPRLVDELVQKGVPIQRGVVHFAGHDTTAEINLSLIPSTYNFILALPQWITEKGLEGELNRAGGAIEWGSELIDCREDENGVACEVLRADGSREMISASYVVGCDGAHSRVRHASGIEFAGGSYEGDFLLGDVDVAWPYEAGKAHAFFGDDGGLVGFPLECNGTRHRIIVALKGAAPPHAPDPTLDDLNQLARKFAGPEVRLSNPYWITRFRLHHRITQSMRRGRFFLAGDAAHLHSPVGGQGMNTGIQDALNLGHRLAVVMKDEAAESLLDGYEAERLPVARMVVRTTDLGFRAFQAKSPLLQGLRNRLIPRLLRSHRIQRRLAAALSEVKVARKEIRERSAFVDAA